MTRPEHDRGPELRGLRILITGGGGFIGSHLCRRLGEQGCEVHATSRHDRAGGGEGPTWWQADLSDISTARRVLTEIKPDIIYHLAGSVGASPEFGLVAPAFHSLLTSTVNLLISGTEVGCARILLSGSFTEPLPASTHPCPSSPYAAAKWAASGYGRMFHGLFNAPVVILQPFMVYGPHQAPTKLIPSVISSLLRQEAPKVSSGRRTADWIFIDDVIDGFVSAATTPGIEGMTIDLGSGELVSVREIVDSLVAIVGCDVRPQFGAVADRPGENEIFADIDCAATALGWARRIPLREGLRRTVEWHRAANPQDVKIAPLAAGR